MNTVRKGSFSGAGLLTIQLAIVLGAAGVARAQPLAAQPNTETNTNQVEEIVVTARKRGEPIQATPVSITALSSTQLDQQNILSLERIRDFVPNLDIGVTSGSTTAANVYIRGIGTYDYQIYTDAPVTTYVDGVLVSLPDAQLLGLVDLDRVEVLRGPQGTLFGRNTTGGAISIYTKAPSDTFGAQEKLTYGTDNELISRTILNTGELGDSGLKIKLAYDHHQRDGYITNLDQGGDRNPGWLNEDSVWVGIHGDVTNDLSFDYRFDYTDHRGQEAYSQVVAATPAVAKYFSKSAGLGGDPFVVPPNRIDSAYAGNQPPDDSTFFDQSLTIDYKPTDALNFKDILANRISSIDEYINISGQGNLLGPVVGFANPRPVTPYNLPNNISRQHQLTNEFQILGTLGEVSYVGGIYYLHSYGSLDNPNVFTFVLPGGNLGANQVLTRQLGLTTDSYAGFGQVSYKPEYFGQKLEIAAGLRYTHDEKGIDEHTSFGSVPSEVRDTSASWHNLSGLGSITYNWTDTFMTYLRISSAYRAGGFVPNTIGSYNPEDAISYEVGIKADWFNKRLRTNLSAFRTDYSDLQVQNVINGLPVITNAGKATYTGGELEIAAVPLDGWEVEFNLGYVDPEYQQYLYVDPVSGKTLNLANEAKFNGVSKLNLNFGLEHTFAPFAFGQLIARMDYSYRSRKVWFPLDRLSPFNEQVASPAYSNLSARLILDQMRVGNFDVRAELWGDNLTDETVVAAGNDFGSLGFGTVIYQRMRTVGLNFTLSY